MDIKRRVGQAYGIIGKDETPRAPGPDAGKNTPTARRPVPARTAGVPPVKSPAPKAGAAQAKTKPTAQVTRATETSESFIKTGASGITKAAKFLLLLGQDEAANVIRHLKPAEIEKVSREIATIDRIDTTEANEILTEFGWLAKTQGANLEGGPEIAERMLQAAFGADKAREVLRKAMPESIRPFAFLNDFDARQLMVLLKDESPQMLAMILTYIEPKLASGVLSELPAAIRADVIKRIARLDRASPEVIERIEAVLRDKAARIGRTDVGERIDGAAVLAGILKHIDGDLEDSILSGIDEDNPDLSRNIRERLFTIDDILRVPDRAMQKGLRELSEHDIALVLKGKSQEFRDKVLANVSQGKRTMVLEEYDIMGTVRRDEAEKATRGFLEYYKRRWESGELVLDGDDDLID